MNDRNDMPSNLPTPSQPDHDDTRMDANLRLMARHVAIPGEPVVGTVRHEARASRAERPARRRLARPRWLAATSALAAGLAIGTVLWTQHSSSRVHAAEILASLRQSQVLGMDIELDRFSGEGPTVDGVVRVRAARPISLARIDDDSVWDDAGFGGAYARLRVTTGPDGPMPGSDMTVEAAFTSEVGWLYVKGDAATIDRMAAVFPEAAGFLTPARTGLLLNVGPVDEQTLNQFGRVLSVQVGGGGDADNDAGVDGPARSGVWVSSSITRVEPGAPEEPGGSGIKVNVTSRVSAGPDAAAGPHAEALGRLSEGLLRGTAGRGELDQIRALLNGQDQQMVVNDLGGGRYELVARLKDEGETDVSAELRVFYQQDAGVSGLEVRPLRDATGVLRLSMAQNPIPASDLAPERLANEPGVVTMDLRLLRSMLLGAPTTPDDAPGQGGEPAAEPTSGE